MLEKLAQKIAASTSEVIGYDVIVTDENSIIIGASDPSRIGAFNEGSVRVINTRKSNDPDYFKNKIGTKPGISLPIEMAGKAIGAIGITGDYNEVKKYGMLVKKHAEIILYEEVILKSALLREQSLQNLIQEILVFDPTKTDEMLLLTRGYELGYDLKPPHIAIAFDFYPFGELIKEVYHQKGENESAELSIQSIKLDVIAKIKNIFNKPNDIFNSLGTDKFIVFYSLSYNFDKEKTFQKIREKCSLVMDKLKEEKLVIPIGIGSIARNITELSRSYRDAWQALEIGKKVKNKPDIFSIEEFYIEQLVSNISRNACQQFVAETLRNLEQQSDWPELSKTIRAWCESGFNQIEAAKSLFIHRNTLCHRLNKIDQISGMNTRYFRDALALYLAILMIDASG